jgi:hypothetical protein
MGFRKFNKNGQLQVYSSGSGGGGGAATTSEFLLAVADAGLTGSRTLTAGTGIDLVDAGAGSTLTVKVEDTAVTPATYGGAGYVVSITVDQQGRITAASATLVIDDSTTSATKAWSSTKTSSEIATQIAAIVDSSPATLDTLNELAAALADDPNFATTMTTALAAKAPLASPALTGTPTAPTAATATNDTQIATTAFVQQEIAALGGDYVPLFFLSTVLSPLDSTSYYFMAAAFTTNSAIAIDNSLGFDCTLIGAIVTVSNNSTSGSSEACNLYLRNTTAGTSSLIGSMSINASTTTSISQTFTGLNIPVAAADNITFQLETPVFATNPIGATFRGYLIFKR